MRVGRRWMAGLFAASLLVPVPALAIHQSIATRSVSARQFGVVGGATARELVLHQLQERRQYLAFARGLRFEFRRGGGLVRASVERVLRDVLLDLRAHWRLETRTRTIASPFDFPQL